MSVHQSSIFILWYLQLSYGIFMLSYVIFNYSMLSSVYLMLSSLSYVIFNYPVLSYVLVLMFNPGISMVILSYLMLSSFILCYPAITWFSCYTIIGYISYAIF